MSESIYRIIFNNQDKVYEVYARFVDPAPMFGFVQIAGFLFGERTSVVVDPSEEKLRDEFEGVEATQIPMHSVIRIDQVERRGAARITERDGSNVTPFPVYGPGGQMGPGSGK
ncbi:DUF1820 family protein [Natronospira bacteriovora]|uniref:DUF1820 family protein n=1 Tax=Natronospira bacteriovora TaxID=3069753 RepID=A0ABU0W3I2_9GAMM|nr:DUF1820 family protein [Natronospira sp. AB-CW4]MDQ2068576.1 DUF1820 family protein [Natronospira sp. AB-CW4]